MDFKEDEINNIIKSYCEGYSLYKLGRLYKTRDENIRNVLINNNITIRGRGVQVNKANYNTNRKRFFNENYFEIIDSEHKAYWLGFMYADGNVYVRKSRNGNTKGASIEITLKREDEYQLYNFIDCIEGKNLEVKKREVLLNGNIYFASRVVLGSIKMARDLIDKGCMPNKSLILQFPRCLTSGLLPHFIRGYIDGDGCIAFGVYDKSSSFHVSLVGTYDFLTGVKNTLKNNHINSYDIKPEKSKAFSLTIGARDNLVNLYNYIYKDATIFLDRKIDKFRQALLYCDKDFEISPIAKFFCLLDEDLQDLQYKKQMKC